MTLNIIFAGVGGQGIIVASDIYCEAAVLEDFDVGKAETHGMAQRGGSIIAHVRIGREVESPLIERGSADILLGFEVIETLRALIYLKEEGVMIMNRKYIPPAPVLQGLEAAPDVEGLIEEVKTGDYEVYEVFAADLAAQLGNPVVMNTVMVGTMVALPETPVSEEAVRRAISRRLRPEFREINYEALRLGIQSLK